MGSTALETRNGGGQALGATTSRLILWTRSVWHHGERVVDWGAMSPKFIRMQKVAAFVELLFRTVRTRGGVNANGPGGPGIMLPGRRHRTRERDR